MVFDRFWQADPARVGHGTGLGLSIVAAIVAEHRGEAVAIKESDGGATVSIRLPARVQNSVSPAVEPI